MMQLRILLTATFLFLAVSGVGLQLARADEVISEYRLPGTNYCHMKFPAIREDTLSWSEPVLKSSNTSDIIDFYGPCSYDPNGKRAVERQSSNEMDEVLQDGE